MEDFHQELAELDAIVAREGDASTPDAQQRVAAALLQKAATLRTTGRLEQDRSSKDTTR